MPSKSTGWARERVGKWMIRSLTRLQDYIVCAARLGRTPVDKWMIFWKETKNIRARLGLERYHNDRIYPLHTIFGDLFFRDNFGDITNLPNIYYRQVYQVNQLKHPGVIFDVGANIGLFSAWVAYHNPGYQVHSFEPMPENVAMIRLNCPAAQVNQVAVGSTPGETLFDVDNDNVMASSLPRERSSRPKSYPVITLDDYSKAAQMERVALLKIDAEGMEIDILNGARETLLKTQQVVMETHGQERHSQAIQILRAAGYVIEVSTFDGQTGMAFAQRLGAESA